MSCITAINSGDTKVGVEKKNAAANVPVRFANNTNPHKRITFIIMCAPHPYQYRRGL